MIGLLTFSKGIFCKKEALGRTYSGQIAGINVGISFPGSPDISNRNQADSVGMSNPLLPPSLGKNLKRGDEKVFWGYPLNYPSLSSFVKCALVEIDCQEHEYEVIAQKLYAAIGIWENAVTSYCQLCSKQNLYRDENNQNNTSNLELLSSKGYIQNRTPKTIFAHFYLEDTFISKEQLEQAISFATSGKELLLEYQLLLSAYKARKKLQNRQAIIDACSAAEICLVGRINDYCFEKGIDPEILLTKYKSLGDRFRLVAKLDSDFTSVDYNNMIVKPRNDIAHNRKVYPTNETTDKLISAVEQYLQHYHMSYY